MDAILTSVAAVALAEIGDKTQLLAIVLAARFRQPLTIIAGILLTTLANHFAAAWLGSTVASFLDGAGFRYLVALSFIAMAAWCLIPDTLDVREEKRSMRWGAFATTMVAFFLVEMGDKTQIATIALGARFNDVGAVALGTAMGMLIANVPAVLAGQVLIERIPLRAMRIVAALLFFGLGLWLLFQAAAQ